MSGGSVDWLKLLGESEKSSMQIKLDELAVQLSEAVLAEQLAKVERARHEAELAKLLVDHAKQQLDKNLPPATTGWKPPVS